MFTKPETQNIVSRLILSEATFGIFGLVLLVVMLCLLLREQHQIPTGH